MKRRCFDHIDLRVKDMKVARKFYAKFLASHKTKNISQTEHASHSGRTRARKWTGLRILCEKRAGELSKARKSVASTVRATTHFSSKTPTETSWRFAAGKVRSLRNERISAKS